jgi:NodT family efflux transporter outer membrane factor (OMF) lipoprotein
MNAMDFGLTMDWDLDFFGKNNQKWKSAYDSIKAAQAEFNQSRLVASSQIADAYFYLQMHLATLEINRSLLGLRKQISEMITLRTDIGLDTQSTTLSALNDISAAEKLLEDIEQLARLDKSRLFVLMGLNPDTDRDIELHFEALESPLPIPKEISSNFLARRPDVMAAIWRVEKAAAEIRVAKLEFYPSVNLQGLALFRSVFPKDLFALSPSSIEDSLLPTFTLPLFRGGQLHANLKEKIADFEEEAAIYHDTLLHALQEVHDLLIQIEVINNQIGSQKDIYTHTEQLRNLAEMRLEVGTTNFIDFLNQEFSYLNQKNTLISVQANKIQLAVKLMKSLGGGYNSLDDVPEYFMRTANCE